MNRYQTKIDRMEKTTPTETNYLYSETYFDKPHRKILKSINAKYEPKRPVLTEIDFQKGKW